jgi:hypothetical protein
MISIPELVTLEDKETEGTRKHIVINYVLVALGDWPIPMNSLEEYETAVTTFLNAPVANHETIVKALELPNPDPESESWEMESLVELAEALSIAECSTIPELAKWIQESV